MVCCFFSFGHSADLVYSAHFRNSLVHPPMTCPVLTLSMVLPVKIFKWLVQQNQVSLLYAAMRTLWDPRYCGALSGTTSVTEKVYGVTGMR